MAMVAVFVPVVALLMPPSSTSCADCAAAVRVGASLVPVIVTVTAWLAVSPSLSFTVMVKVSVRVSPTPRA